MRNSRPIVFFLGVLSGAVILLPAIAPQSAHAQEAAAPTGSSMAEGPADEDSLAKDASTEINVKNADLTAIVRIFSKKTRRNFILDERVKGKVSIYLPGKVSTEESLRILDSVLSYKGFASVPIGPNLWKIVPSKEARTTTIPTQRTRADGTPGPEIVTRLVQLKFIGADEARQLVQQLISGDGFISAYASTNSLILIDSEDNIERLIDIINTLDVPFSNREMTIIPIVNAEAKDIADKLSEILGLSSSQGGSASGQSSNALDFGLELARARVRQMAMQTASQPGTQLGMPAGQPAAIGGQDGGSSPAAGTRALQPKIIADERTNSIIVVADEDITARVQALVSQLDSKIDLSGSQYWIYRCQHAKAEELADVLGGLVGEGSGSGSKSGGSSDGGGLFDTSQDLISGSSGRSQNRSRTQDRMRGQTRTPGQQRSSGSNSRGVSSVELGDNFSITADAATNTLIILANKNDYQKIRSLLDKIDVKRRQVLVEAMLLEVGIDDTRNMSTSWLASGGGADGGIIAGNNAGNIASLLSNPSGVQDFAVAVASAGTLTIGDTTLPSQSLLLNAVKSNSNLNLLSAPTILTTDNEEAEIVVGQNVPFITSTSTNADNLDNTFNQVERQDVGITLRLTPQISSGDSVTLQIFTEVSNIVSSDPSLGPTTSVRTSETSVITKDGQMIVIGGLMGDGINESERGVPYLKDIPVLGHLFKSTTERRVRTNLLILITPRIIRDQYDARDATISRREQVERDIAVDEHFPDRSDVLRNPRIDHVSEASSYDGPLPSTIFEPAKAADSTKEGPDSPSAANVPEHSDAASDEKVLEFTIEPKFPSDDTSGESAPSTTKPLSETESGEAAARGQLALGSAPSAGRPVTGQQRRAALDSDAVNSGAINSAEQRFVVLQAEGKMKIPTSLPFKVRDGKRLAGIVVPASPEGSALKYFSAGASCTYETSEGALTFTSLGVFPSSSDAAVLFPDLKDGGANASWYTLSPYEILSLGEGPWK